MAKITSVTEQFQHFLTDVKESFWGDLYGRTRQAWKQLFELESQRLRDRHCGLQAWERAPRVQPDYRNGFYERDFVTRFGTIRLRPCISAAGCTRCATSWRRSANGTTMR